MISETPWVFVHQEYPKTLHRPDGSTCTVLNDEARDLALADGWYLRPGAAPAPLPEPEPVPEPLLVEPAEPKPSRRKRAETIQ